MNFTNGFKIVFMRSFHSSVEQNGSKRTFCKIYFKTNLRIFQQHQTILSNARKLFPFYSKTGAFSRKFWRFISEVFLFSLNRKQSVFRFTFYLFGTFLYLQLDNFSIQFTQIHSRSPITLEEYAIKLHK